MEQSKLAGQELPGCRYGFLKGDGLVISDRLLRSWLRCPRKAWQDLHGDPTQRTWHPQRAIQLGQEQRCVNRYGTGRGLTMARGAAEAFRGAAVIQGLRLLAQEERIQLRGRVPLLVRCDARSRLGPWSYMPLLVCTGRFIGREQRLCLAFLGRLLQGFQGRCPPHGLVLSADGGCQQVALDPLQPQLDALLEEMATGLGQPHAPELIAERKRCSICVWRRPCNAHAAASGHLGDVSGVGAGRRRQLIQLQIPTIAELARSDPSWLGQALAQQGHPSQADHHNALAAALVLQARSQESQQVRRRPGPASLSARTSLTARLHQSPGVLFYDIEADPDARENYLHGFLIRTRQDPGSPLDLTSDPTGATPRHHPILCLPQHGDVRCWQRIHRLLRRFPGWPLLHYGETERIELHRLARRAGASAASREDLERRFVDVHQLVRQQWVLPLSSYGLKSVATWLGFRWRHPNAEGARAVLWWRHWRRHGHRHDLRRILDYNQDDCQATRVVAAWLLAQEQAPWPKLNGAPWGPSNLVNAADS